MYDVAAAGVNTPKIVGCVVDVADESYTVMVGVLDAELTKMPFSLPAIGLMLAEAVMYV
jgi:hypothetical protein